MEEVTRYQNILIDITATAEIAPTHENSGWHNWVPNQIKDNTIPKAFSSM